MLINGCQHLLWITNVMNENLTLDIEYRTYSGNNSICNENTNEM